MNSLTETELESKIKNIEYVKHTSSSGIILRWCIFTLENEFTVHAEASCCLDPSNDDASIGERVAYENTFKKLWQLEGYLRTEEYFKDK